MVNISKKQLEDVISKLKKVGNSNQDIEEIDELIKFFEELQR